MLYKEDIENVLREELYSPIKDGDILTALINLYNQLPYRECDTCNKIEIPVRGLDIDIIPDDKPLGENDFLAYKSTKHELQDLADELNEAEPIDWNNYEQRKYCIVLDFRNNILDCPYNYSFRSLNIYSTDERFLEKAKERIGEDRLIKLFKEGI